MAYDKVIDSSVLDGNLTSIANAIREKAELTENFAFPQGFIDAISGISVGGAGNLVIGTITPTAEGIIELDDVIPNSNVPLCFGVFEDLVDYPVPDLEHTVTRALSYFAGRKPYDINPSFQLSVAYQSAGATPVKHYDSSVATFYKHETGTSKDLSSVMRCLIDGDTRKLMFLRGGSQNYMITGRTYYYFIVYDEV